jgi:streptogramin lyase
MGPSRIEMPISGCIKSSRRGGRSAALILAVVGAGLARITDGQVITEFTTPTADGDPYRVATGPDGNLWFTELAGKIGRITPAGVITEFTVPTAFALPQGIAAGPDGNVWFTERDGNIDKVGRITTAGVITEFTVPTHAAGVAEIALGPDGNLWFTEDAANKIGRITTGGKFSEFTLPRMCPSFARSCYPEGIVAGPDGNLWFSEAAGSSIGRITTSGVITEFTAAASNSIALGPDGNLWFTENTNTIGRITTVGLFDEFTMPDVGSAARDIAAGPDGNLWFTEPSGKIGRITTAGVITEFTVPIAGSSPFDIAAGPDGNLWFTEYGSLTDKIGRITTALAAPCVVDSRSLCLNNSRFHVSADWRVPSNGTSGQGTAVPLTGDTGYFWFFTPANIEVVVKVLNGCSVGGHYWVFAGGLTNVQVTLTVTDAQTGETKPYTNPDGTAFRPVEDTAAFATCP